jgi:amino acid adenylation domain-containing protein
MTAINPKSGAAQQVDFDPFAGGENILFTAPSTESQKEIWSSVQMGNDANCAYNESISLVLKGDLDLAALRRALCYLIGRHEALRMLFGPDGKTLCVTAAPDSIEVPLIDLSGLSPSDRENRLVGELAKAVETPFNIEHGPLFSVSIIKIENALHRLIFTAHHIVCDGWSTAVLLPEMAQAYSSFKKNGSAPTLSPADAFSEYSRSQETYIKSKEFAETIAYWLGRFEPLPPQLDLPLPKLRPANRTFASLREDFVIEAALVSDLKRIGAQAGCSFFVTMLAAFKVLLMRLSGQSDLTVGIPSAGQSAVGKETLVGHCVNVLPLRSQLTLDQPFLEVIRGVKTLMLDAMDHQQFTFGSIIPKLSLKRDPGRIPLVPVLFNLDQSINAAKLPFEGLEVEFISNPRHFENFELFVNAMESKGTLIVECQYNTDLFNASTIRQWSKHFIELLKAAAADPAQTIGRLPLLSREDLERQLKTWNNTAREFPAAAGAHELFSRQAASAPERVAVTCGGKQLTYGQLDAAANRLARYLQSIGAMPGMLIGVSVERSIDMIIALFGILKTGAAYVPLDPEYPSERLSYMLSDAAVTIVVSQESVRSKLPDSAARVVSLDGDAPKIAACGDSPLTLDNNDPNGVAYVIYTSGSTGKPKGVQVPHRAVVNFLNSMRLEPGFSPSDVMIAVTTLSFDIAVLELFLPLSLGGRVEIVDRETAMDGEKLKNALRESGATVMQATPSTWRLLLAAGWTGSPTLRILCGGEAFPVDLVGQLLPKAAEIWNMYGPTETTVWSTCLRVTDPSKPPSIGRPIANTSTYIVDSLMQPVPVGVPGELCIGGAGVTLRYLNRPELTHANFIPNPFGNDLGEIIYKTGDMAAYGADGTINYFGRIDTQVKIRGFRIELGEIEAAIVTHETVEQVVVIKVEPKPNDVRIAAYIKTKKGAEVDGAALRNHVRGKLPEYMVPQHFIALETFPLTPAGKIDRKQLSATFSLSEPSSANFAPPATETQASIAAIWREVLGYGTIGINDNFFDIGGHSLLVTQIISRVRRDMAVELSMRRFFEMPTVALQAEYLDAVTQVRRAAPTTGNDASTREEIEL